MAKKKKRKATKKTKKPAKKVKKKAVKKKTTRKAKPKNVHAPETPVESIPGGVEQNRDQTAEEAWPGEYSASDVSDKVKEEEESESDF